MTKREKIEMFVLISITILTVLTIVLSCVYISSTGVVALAEELYLDDSEFYYFNDSSLYDNSRFTNLFNNSYGNYSPPIIISNNGDDIASSSALFSNGFNTISELYYSVPFDYIDNYTYSISNQYLVKSDVNNAALFCVSIPCWGTYNRVIDRLEYNGGTYEHLISFGCGTAFFHFYRGLRSSPSDPHSYSILYFFTYGTDSITDYSTMYDVTLYYADYNDNSTILIDSLGNSYYVINSPSPSVSVRNWYVTFYVGLGSQYLSNDLLLRTYLSSEDTSYEDIIFGIGKSSDNVNMLYNSFYNLSNLNYYNYTNYTYLYQKNYYNIIYNEGYQQALTDYDTIDNSTWLSGIFNSFSSFFSIKLFGNVTVGLLLFIPLILSVLLFIFKLARG